MRQNKIYFCSELAIFLFSFPSPLFWKRMEQCRKNGRLMPKLSWYGTMIVNSQSKYLVETWKLVLYIPVQLLRFTFQLPVSLENLLKEVNKWKDEKGDSRANGCQAGVLGVAFKTSLEFSVLIISKGSWKMDTLMSLHSFSENWILLGEVCLDRGEVSWVRLRTDWSGCSLSHPTPLPWKWAPALPCVLCSELVWLESAF